MLNLYILMIEALACVPMAFGAGWVVGHGDTAMGFVIAICGAAFAIDATWRFIKLVWGME